MSVSIRSVTTSTTSNVEKIVPVTTIRSLPDDLHRQICGYLPPSVVASYSQALRQKEIAQIGKEQKDNVPKVKAQKFDPANDELVWRDRLGKDFGLKEADKLRLNPNNKTQYNTTYRVCFIEAKSFINSLPKGNPSQSKGNPSQSHPLLQNSKDDFSTRIYGQVSPGNLTKYINSLSVGELAEVFYKSARFGFIELFETIINSPSFTQISQDNLIHAAKEAVQHGHVDCLDRLLVVIDKLQPNDISTIIYSAFESAIHCIVDGKDKAALDRIMKDKHFANIRPNMLGMMFTLVARAGLLKEMEQIMALQAFTRINLRYFEYAYALAKYHGHFVVANRVDACKRFTQVEVSYLEELLELSFSYKDNDQALRIKRLSAINGYARISPNILKKAINRTAKEGNEAVVCRLLAHPRSGEISWFWRKAMQVECIYIRFKNRACLRDNKQFYNNLRKEIPASGITT